MTLRPVSMDFNYGSSFGERSPSAYETLLLDAIIGDATLYTRQDMVEASWAVVEPIQNAWHATQVRFPQLSRGHLGTGQPPTRCWPAAATNGGSRDGRYRIARPHPERTLRAVGVARQAGQGESGAGVLRACSMTLVVLAEESGGCRRGRRDRGRADAASIPPRHRGARARRRRAGARPSASSRSAGCRSASAARSAASRSRSPRRDAALGRRAAGGAAAGRRRSAGDPLVPQPAPARHAGVPPDGGDGPKVVLDSAAMPDPRVTRCRLADDAGRGGHARRSGLDPPHALARDARADLRESRDAALCPGVTKVRVTFAAGAPTRPRGTWRRGSAGAVRPPASWRSTPDSGVRFLRVELTGEGPARRAGRGRKAG